MGAACQPLPLRRRRCPQLYGRILETQGAAEENGVLIGDCDEQWYAMRREEGRGGLNATAGPARVPLTISPSQTPSWQVCGECR